MRQVRFFLALLLCGAACHAGSDPSPVPGGELELYVGETSVMPRPSVRRVIVGRSSILHASAMANGDVVLVARSPGHTSLSLLDANGMAERWSVRVMPVDMQRLAREIETFVDQMPNVSVRTLGDKIIVDGSDLSESQLFKLAELARHYPQVVNLAAFQKDRAWERMVLIDVQVAEVARNRTRDLGVRWESTLPGPQVEPFKGRIGVASSIGSTISLLESEGDAVVLADPQLTARSGKKASFLVGGEIPYQAINQDGSAQVTFKKFGVELEVTPIAMESGAIVSSVRAMVSEPDATLNPLSGVPGLRSREAETWFNVKSGETMVIAGLLQRNGSSTSDRVPGVSRVPILGHLFRGKRSQRRDTELVIFVTARTVEPSDQKQAGRGEAVRQHATRTLDAGLPLEKETLHAR
jgi:pilus assembly protein CpaC